MIAEGRIDDFRLTDLAPRQPYTSQSVYDAGGQGVPLTTTGYSHGGTTNVANMMMYLNQDGSTQFSPETTHNPNGYALSDNPLTQ